jgi:hypothetical protein
VWTCIHKGNEHTAVYYIGFAQNKYIQLCQSYPPGKDKYALLNEPFLLEGIKPYHLEDESPLKEGLKECRCSQCRAICNQASMAHLQKLMK